MSAALLSRVRPRDPDTRILVAGVVALLALIAYLVVAFVNTHAATVEASKVAPWTPYASKLVPVRRRHGEGFAIQVTPVSGEAKTHGSYGALVQTLLLNPKPGRRYTVSLWLRGARPGRIGVEVNEFRGPASVYPVNTTVPATRRWRHFTFSVRVKGDWLGLAMYVFRPSSIGVPTWFAIRGLTLAADR